MQVHIILVHADEQTFIHGVYRNLEDARAELNNPAYGEFGSEEWANQWVDGAGISTYELK